VGLRPELSSVPSTFGIADDIASHKVPGMATSMTTESPTLDRSGARMPHGRRSPCLLLMWSEPDHRMDEKNA
jgi:hypothetical protein